MPLALIDIRKQKKMGQLELSQKSGVPQSIISDIENEKTRNPRIDTVKKLADALGCTVDDLLKDAKAV